MKSKTAIAWFVLSLLFLIPISSMAQRQRAIQLIHEEFQIIYDTQLNSPRAIRWLILPSHLSARASRSGLSFRADSRLPKPRVTTSDFVRSGYQRGHMCPAADWACSLSSMKKTFLLSNISPQVAGLNTGEWKMTEIISRQMARQYGRCSVAVAPIFLPEDTVFIGRHRAAVPHAFFKVAWVPDCVSIWRMWLFLNK